jgi:hypothetical protein
VGGRRRLAERGPDEDGVEPAIATVGGTPYVACEENNGVNQIRVKSWNGAAWVSVGDRSTPTRPKAPSRLTSRTSAARRM